MANWDGNGNIDRDYFPEDDRDAGVEILASKFDNWMASITNVIENCYTLDSQTLPISNLNMNSKKIANLSNGTATLDAVNYSQLSAVETKVDENTAAIAGLSNRGYINGGVASSNATTPDDIIDITSLKARSSDDTQDLEVDAASLDITQTASWADSTVPTLTDLTVHIWADYNTGTQRFILDDVTGSNIAGAKRWVGKVKTDSSEDIRPFEYKGEGSQLTFLYDEILLADNTMPTTETLVDTGLPTGSEDEIIGMTSVQNTVSGSTVFAHIASGNVDYQPNEAFTAVRDNVAEYNSLKLAGIFTNTSGEVWKAITLAVNDFSLNIKGAIHRR